MFDCHIHTKNSHDSTQTLTEICESAIAKGLFGVSICDHVDICFAEERQTYQAMQSCIAEVREAKEKFAGRLSIMQGMELAGSEFDLALRDRFMCLCQYDIILGSVHTVYLEDVGDSYSRVDWSAGAKSMERIRAFFAAYLQAVREMIDRDDFDVLAHLTCPLRYINGKFGRGLDEREFASQIEDILSAIIQKDIALEVNTSGVHTEGGEWLPSEAILRRYFEKGGRLITIGSDAHVPQNIGNAFDKTVEMLKEIGFSSYCYYEKREPKWIAM